MKNIEIENKNYEMPENWSEISVEKFENIIKLSGLLNEYKSNIQFALEMFSLLLDAPIEVIKKLDKGSFNILSEECKWVNEEVKPKKVEKFEIDGELYVPINDFNKMTMGEAIDLELIMNESNNENLLGNILPILIRKSKAVLNENGEMVLKAESFNADDYKKNRELFRKKLMVGDVIYLKNFF